MTTPADGSKVPTLADLIIAWVEERDLNVRVEGPDNFYSSLYYIDANAPKDPKGEWLADIDNASCEVFLRVNKQVMIVLDAADPEFFDTLEIHIKAFIGGL